MLSCFSFFIQDGWCLVFFLLFVCVTVCFCVILNLFLNVSVLGVCCFLLFCLLFFCYVFVFFFGVASELLHTCLSISIRVVVFACYCILVVNIFSFVFYQLIKTISNIQKGV